jgi:hypothetical protein
MQWSHPGGVAEWLNAALSKSVVRLIGVPGVRISPPPYLHRLLATRSMLPSGLSWHRDYLQSARGRGAISRGRVADDLRVLDHSEWRPATR